MNKSVISIITPIMKSTLDIRYEVLNIPGDKISEKTKESLLAIADLTLDIEKELENAIFFSCSTPRIIAIDTEKEIVNA